jgi:arylsulfatase A-like enzyme
MSDNGGQESWTPSNGEYNKEHGPNDVLGNNLPLRDWKTALYEGGIRVPAIISWPGQFEKSKLDEVISVTDILPTLAHIVGFEITDEMDLDGKNIWPALSKGSKIDDREIYGRTKKQFALRQGDWKLIHNGKTLRKGNDELYNLKNDPYEKNDIAKDHPKKVESLLERIKVLSESDIIVNYPDAG